MSRHLARFYHHHPLLDRRPKILHLGFFDQTAEVNKINHINIIGLAISTITFYNQILHSIEENYLMANHCFLYLYPTKASTAIRASRPHIPPTIAITLLKFNYFQFKYHDF